MVAPKGNQYALGNSGPPPSKYTPEFIEKEAVELVKWCKKEDSFFLKTFAADRDYLPDQFSFWAKKNQVFSKALKKSHDLIEGRLAKCGLTNKTNAGFTKWVLACNYKWREPPTEVINTTSKSGAEQYIEDQEKKYAEKDEQEADCKSCGVDS